RPGGWAFASSRRSPTGGRVRRGSRDAVDSELAVPLDPPPVFLRDSYPRQVARLPKVWEACAFQSADMLGPRQRRMSMKNLGRAVLASLLLLPTARLVSANCTADDPD